jgi:ssDNA-binding Zn-finger/Zn-ribbon topoisomerase 1
MIFEATCLGCGKRQGIQLPKNMQSMMACSIAEQISFNQRCSCGGSVVVDTYEGRLDKDRNIIDEN